MRGKPVISHHAIVFCIPEFRIMPPFRRRFMLQRSASCPSGASSAIGLASWCEALLSSVSSVKKFPFPLFRQILTLKSKKNQKFFIFFQKKACIWGNMGVK